MYNQELPSEITRNCLQTEDIKRNFQKTKPGTICTLKITFCMKTSLWAFLDKSLLKYKTQWVYVLNQISRELNKSLVVINHFFFSLSNKRFSACLEIWLYKFSLCSNRQLLHSRTASANFTEQRCHDTKFSFEAPWLRGTRKFQEQERKGAKNMTPTLTWRHRHRNQSSSNISTTSRAFFFLFHAHFQLNYSLFDHHRKQWCHYWGIKLINLVCK